MALYTPPTLSGYNSSPPSDDGSTTAANQVKWSTIKTKLTDPLNTYAQAIDTRVSAVLTTNALDLDGNPLVMDADGDTKLDASTDDVIQVYASGAEIGRFTTSGLQIGTTGSSSYKLFAYGTTDALLRLEEEEASASAGPTISLYRNSATPADGDDIGQARFTGNNETAGSAVTYAIVRGRIVDASDGTEDGAIEFRTIQNGADTVALNIGAGLYTANATGNDQGLGSINADAVYDDGVLLTCYVLEAWLDGAVQTASWDAHAPDKGEGRAHAPARGFAQVARDRLDTDALVEYMRTHRKLPAFPGPDRWEQELRGKMSVGSASQRLWETVELLAVHIAKLHERIKLLEGS